MIEIKKTGNRYYKYSVRDFRSFPISKVEAEKLIAEGKAEMVDRWWHEAPIVKEATPVKEVPQNVVSLAEIKAKKAEQTAIDNAKQRFITEIIPNLSKESLQKLAFAALHGDKEEYQAEMMRVLLEVSIAKL